MDLSISNSGNSLNIIWITLESLLPANTGGKIGVLKRLEQIGKKHRIFLFYPYDEKEELGYVNELKSICYEVHAYSRFNNKLRALLGLYKYPYTVSSRVITNMKDDICEVLDNNHIDIVNVDFPHMLAILLGIDKLPSIILNEHNLEFDVYKRISKSQNSIVKKILYAVDSKRLYNYEKRIVKSLNVNNITFVSKKDLDEYQKYSFCKNGKYFLIPVGADQQTEVCNTKCRSNEKIILFVGKMSYAPNIEGVCWFVKYVLPCIKDSTTYDIKFYIVGKDPSKEVLALNSDTVIVTGTVDSVKPYYEKADLVVLPLLNGGGVKIKLLEAISYKKSIISSSIGVEGTLYADDNSVFVCDDPDSFAEKCVLAIEDNIEVERRREKAYDIFIHNYTWKSIAEEYERVLCQVSNGLKERG